MKTSARIGLMADTHGNVHDLENSIVALKQADAKTLVHLGDFFDSVNTETLVDIAGILRREGVFAVMGNNDYQVLNRLKNNCLDMPDRPREMLLSFLDTTPILRRMDNICFAHSLPYDSIRSFYEPIDDGTISRAADIFSGTRHRVLFCGHSHLPALFTCHKGRVTRQAPIVQRVISFTPGKRYIIVVGSPLSGECGIYDHDLNQYERVLL